MKCLIDDSEHESLKDLHSYLRAMKTTQAKYYEKYFPRADLWTGEKIMYKSFEQYIDAEFKDKINLKKFLKESPDARQWSVMYLEKRMKRKKLIYSPCQVELRSLVGPDIKYYNSIGGYQKICQEVGMFNRHLDEELRFGLLDDNMVIIQDTREQRPLSFKYKTIVEKLDEGDYGQAAPWNQDIYIERKSLNDFVGTLSEYDRFDRELARAYEKGKYMVMVVESDINSALGFNFLPQMKYTKTNPAHIFKNLRDLIVKYDNFQVLFVKNRAEAVDKILKIWQLGMQVKRVDLQYKYEKGEL